MDLKLEQTLNNFGIAVIPTDTIYGIVARADSQTAVERLYKVRERSEHKPCIILIAKISDIEHFGVNSKLYTEKLKNYWQDSKPISVVLPCPKPEFEYLHRGTDSLAFRLPKNTWLVNLINKIRPLIAPSANIEGTPPSTTIDGARSQFGNQVDYYYDGGKLEGKPSTLISLLNEEEEEMLRA